MATPVLTLAARAASAARKSRNGAFGGPNDRDKVATARDTYRIWLYSTSEEFRIEYPHRR